MNVLEFQRKWRASTLKEKSAAHEHFLDLCTILGVPTPAAADPNGDFYTFERGAEKTDGGQGWADVWFRGHFAWEYKGQHADLRAAYRQLLQYREDLENPPLLVVCDLDRFEVHTNFTGTIKRVHRFDLDGLSDAANVAILRAVFTAPKSLRPGVSTAEVTEEAAARFGKLALGLHARGVDPHRAAHYLVQLLFCLFAEDVRLLPGRIFSQLVEFGAKRPDAFPREAEQLLTAMRDGGFAAYNEIPHFNGGLFREVAGEPLTGEELGILAEAAKLDWTSVEPAIFGTLFERSLDPGKRAQLGAHYTGRADIERVVDPVLMAPLRRRWEEVRTEADTLKAAWDAATTPRTRDNRRADFAAALSRFQGELAALRVLDPACGSGNFLYVALARLLDLEKEVIAYGGNNGLPIGLPTIRPTQLLGLEVNEYARELAQVVIWIGYLQWMIGNGFTGHRTPILESLETIKLQDALLRHEGGKVSEAEWPEADVIIGNPPFLGGNRVRQELGDEYLADLFVIYDRRVPRFGDLVCYFFEKARAEIAAGSSERAGLLATNSIRGGVNRRVLERIKGSGDIFMAWDDEPWILNGAAVRISIVGFDNGTELCKVLNGNVVNEINSDLTGSIDITVASILGQNAGLCFLGIKKGGPFELTDAQAQSMRNAPVNPNGRTNRDVVRRYINGSDLLRRSRGMWIVDFGTSTPENEAALYEMPYEYLRIHVKPIRDANRRPRRRELWWLFSETAPGMRSALTGRSRQIVTPRVSKFRLFVWQPATVIADDGTVVFARDDDYFFGVLHSRAHEVWSLRMGTWLGKGNDPRYTPTTCFETFRCRGRRGASRPGMRGWRPSPTPPKR